MPAGQPSLVLLLDGDEGLPVQSWPVQVCILIKWVGSPFCQGAGVAIVLQGLMWTLMITAARVMGLVQGPVHVI